MKMHRNIALLGATLAFSITPAVALAVGPPSPLPVPANPGTAHMPTNPGSQGTAHMPTNPGSQADSTPGAGASQAAKGKAYGKYCKGESKKHIAGEHGTPFSKCVTAMAKAANGSTKNPTTLCQTESKMHVDGMDGTPFSKCVSGAAKLLQDQAAAAAPSDS